MTTLRPAIALVVASLSLAAAGCGASDEERIRGAIADLQQAYADGDIGRACELMTRGAQRHLGEAAHDAPVTCVHDLRSMARGNAARRGARDITRPAVTGVRVSGDRATVTLRVGSSVVSHVPMRREDGDWKVDAIYGEIPGAEQKDSY